LVENIVGFYSSTIKSDSFKAGNYCGFLCIAAAWDKNKAITDVEKQQQPRIKDGYNTFAEIHSI
jgi:hypothetical protein